LLPYPSLERLLPWNRVRLKVEILNLIRHVGKSGLKILDAGGGNGYASIPFAQNGCQVVVADYSESMIADDQKLMSKLGHRLLGKQRAQV
jgi:2-polyprenyl-3-methyl-5-hydroxy-6-metoxy-1,4-benzoquinol methylase